ncbi:MAG: PilN domain-containing protein [Deltaproteobacteria bacterium]|nr:PilN domain-containing protein [Deltaproteobacteria bacterium]
MNLFRTVVGIDPSGKRLALSAVRYGVGRPSVAVPPVAVELRGDREQIRMAEAESVLADFVARNGLAGCEARLAIPAEKVFLARIPFPPLKSKDLRPALSLELDRIFPVPASRLKFNWRRLDGAAGRKDVRLVLVAASSEYIERWEELVSRAGLSLGAAVPSGWAMSETCRWAGEQAVSDGKLCAVLREMDGGVECTAIAGGEPFFSAVRACPPEGSPVEALNLLSESLIDAPDSVTEAEASVYAPSWWIREGRFPQAGTERANPVEGFENRMSAAMALPGEDAADPARFWRVLGALGAALCEKGPDLLSPDKEGERLRTTARTATIALAAAALLLALSWPASVAVRTKQAVDRLDAEIASLRPEVARVEETLAILGDLEGRIAYLKEARAGREEQILVLRQLTERLPQGTWLTGLRMEDLKVELDGLSPSANEIFPALARDGQFRKVEFASPITRQADNLERFQIRAEFSPVPPETPAEARKKP